MSISSWWFDPQRALFFLYWSTFFFTSILFGAVLFHNRVTLGADIPGIILPLYDVLYIWHVLRILCDTLARWLEAVSSTLVEMGCLEDKKCFRVVEKMS